MGPQKIDSNFDNFIQLFGLFANWSNIVTCMGSLNTSKNRPNMVGWVSFHALHIGNSLFLSPSRLKYPFVANDLCPSKESLYFCVLCSFPSFYIPGKPFVYDAYFRGPKKRECCTDVVFGALYIAVVICWLSLGIGGRIDEKKFHQKSIKFSSFQGKLRNLLFFFSTLQLQAYRRHFRWMANVTWSTIRKQTKKSHDICYLNHLSW